MSGLLIRASESEGVLRSVGDPPNGIVTTATPRGIVTWAIDPSQDPASFVPSIETDGTMLRLQDTEGGMPANCVPVAPGELVDALESDDEARRLFDALLGSAQAMSMFFSMAGSFEQLVPLAVWAVETRDALAARFDQLEIEGP